MGYFSKFNKIPYDVDGSGFKRAVVNLTSSVKMSDALINEVTFFETVTLHEGERPDQLSQRLYGTTDFYWTFLLANKELKNIWNDWSKSQYQLKEYCEKKYEGVAALVNFSEELPSTKFKVGDLVQVNEEIHHSFIIKGFYTNLGYMLMEPIWYCNKGEGDNRIDCLNATAVSSWREPKVLTDGPVSINTIVPEGELGEGGPKDIITFSGIVKYLDAPHHYINHDGDVTAANDPNQKTIISNYIYEEWLNGLNTQIKIIKPKHIHAIVSEFEKEISK